MIDLKLDSGLLLAVPIDQQDELETDSGDKIETIIYQSLQQATKQGITGNKVTPFVLGEIRRQTGDKSIKTNQNLIYKNARIASQIAVALSSIKTASSSLSKLLPETKKVDF
jgi:pseudouridine-5'-phosphate glycosidase